MFINLNMSEMDVLKTWEKGGVNQIGNYVGGVKNNGLQRWFDKNNGKSTWRNLNKIFEILNNVG